MKTWIRRTVIGVFSVTALFGGLAAWAKHSHGHCFHGGDRAQMKTCMVDYASQRLDLDSTQKTKLNLLADTMQAQRQALVADAANPRAELQQLIAGPSFDRTKASAVLQTKISAVQLKSPEVINAFGDFFDSLRPEQQAKLREAMNRGRHGRRG